MQGTAGNVIPPPGFLPAVRAIAKEHGALFIADEMITGFGRTGKFWGVDHDGVVPDVMTCGKGIGGGFPLAAVVSTDELTKAKPFANPSGSSSSYGGNPLASAAGLAALEIIVAGEPRRELRSASAPRCSRGSRRCRRSTASSATCAARGSCSGSSSSRTGETKELVSKDFTKALFQECLRRGLLAMSYTPIIRINPPLNIDERPRPRGPRHPRRGASEPWRGNGSSPSPEIGRPQRMLKGAILGVGHVAVDGHLPGWRARADVDDRRGRRRAARPARGLRSRRFPNARWYDDGRGAARERTPRLRRHLHAARPRTRRSSARRSTAPLHVLCEKPLVRLPDELRGLPALAAEKERTLCTVHNWKLRAGPRPRIDELLARGALGEVRRVPLGDAARQARRRGRRRRQLARRSGPVRGRGPRRPRLARALRRCAAGCRRAPRTVAARLETRKHHAVADRGHGDLYPRLPDGLRRDLPDVGRRASAPTASRSTGTRGMLHARRRPARRSTTWTARRRSRTWTFPPLTEGSHHPDWFGGVITEFLGEIAEPARARPQPRRGRALRQRPRARPRIRAAAAASRCRPSAPSVPARGDERRARRWPWSPPDAPGIPPETVLLGLPIDPADRARGAARGLRPRRRRRRHAGDADARARGHRRRARSRRPAGRGRACRGTGRRRTRGPEELAARRRRRSVGVAGRFARRTCRAPSGYLLEGLVKDTEGLHVAALRAAGSRSRSAGASPARASRPTDDPRLASRSASSARCSSCRRAGRRSEIGGALLFLLHSILDGCDGELARLKFQESRWGGAARFLGRQRRARRGLRRDGDRLEPRDRRRVAPRCCGALGGRRERSPRPASSTARTMTGRKDGPLFTSVAAPGDTPLSRVADALSRRDFIYLVLILSAFGKADWFLVLVGRRRAGFLPRARRPSRWASAVIARSAS